MSLLTVLPNQPQRRVAAKIEWHLAELFPPVGFFMANLRWRPRRVVKSRVTVYPAVKDPLTWQTSIEGTEASAKGKGDSK